MATTTRKYHYEISHTATLTGGHYGIYGGTPGVVYDTARHAGIKLPTRTASYKTPEARDAAAAKLTAALTALPVDTSMLVLKTSSADGQRLDGDTRWFRLDGTELSIKGLPL